MPAFRTIALTIFGWSLLSAAPALAQAQAQADLPMRLTNANVRQVPASGNLAAQVKELVAQQVDPGWIAYTQPMIEGKTAGCCYGNDGGIYIDGDASACCGMCRLEGDRDGTRSSTGAATPAQPIKLEGSSTYAVLIRVVSKQIDKIRTFSADCQLDGGGRTVTLLTGVRPADSVALLESLVTDVTTASTPERARHGAVGAIALARDPAADASLQRLLSTSYPDSIRRDAVFWLGMARGRTGFEAVKRVINDEKSGSIRKHAVFALSQSREPEVVPTLIDLARNHATAEIRGEAIFWLAHKAGAKTAATITEAIEKDPDTQVKKRAVFALSQMPKDEGVPLLIQIARNNTNPVVRKQAIFWLGQSKDPRALDYFESVLK